MTYQEKKFNKPDLRHYVNKELHTVTALVPGINNLDSVGSRPLKRGAMNLLELPEHEIEAAKRKGTMYFSPQHKSQASLH